MRFFRFLKQLFGRRITEDEGAENSELWQNPYIPYARQVIEEILGQKGLDYRSFRPIVIDVEDWECEPEIGRHVEQVLEQLEEGLNFMEIRTDRPEHFQNWKTWMELEYGLLVKIRSHRDGGFGKGNMILDFSRQKHFPPETVPGHVIYLPFERVPWEPQTAENKEISGVSHLDIKVPIGYNMRIVKIDILNR